MALDPDGLKDALEGFLGTGHSAPAAAAAFAQLYDDYAADGRFGTSAPTLTGRKAVLESAMAAALSSPPPASINALNSGVTAYWAPTPSPIPVVGPQTGTVVGCPGAAAIPAALASLIANPTGNDAATSAAALAGALHTATTTVTANVAPPPGTVLPLA